MSNETENNSEPGADDWNEALAEQEAAETDAAQTSSDENADVAKADFQGLTDDFQTPVSEDTNMEMLLDIPVTLSVEIGRTKINIKNLLKLNQGSVVELDRMAGEPMDVIVNGTLLAHGEVVVVNDKFGIRLTDIISATERVMKLK